MSQKLHSAGLLPQPDYIGNYLGDVAELRGLLDDMFEELQPPVIDVKAADTPIPVSQGIRGMLPVSLKLPTIICTNTDGSNSVIWSDEMDLELNNDSNAESMSMFGSDLSDAEALEEALKETFSLLSETDLNDQPTTTPERTPQERAQVFPRRQTNKMERKGQTSSSTFIQKWWKGIEKHGKRCNDTIIFKIKGR